MKIARLSKLVWPYILAAIACALPVAIGVYRRKAHLAEFGDGSDWQYLVSGFNFFVFLTFATLFFLVVAVSNFFGKRNQE
jgi:hypothetical protein